MGEGLLQRWGCSGARWGPPTPRRAVGGVRAESCKADGRRGGRGALWPLLFAIEEGCWDCGASGGLLSLLKAPEEGSLGDQKGWVALGEGPHATAGLCGSPRLKRGCSFSSESSKCQPCAPGLESKGPVLCGFIYSFSEVPPPGPGQLVISAPGVDSEEN